jgi:hypothetical protein
MNSDVQSKFDALNSLIDETSGTGFYMYCNGSFWTIAITKSGFRANGTIEHVLDKTISEITQNRSLRKTSNTTYKKYVYS